MVAAITITPSPLFGRIGVRPEVRKGSEAAVGGRESADFCRAAPSRLTLGFDRPELGATGNDRACMRTNDSRNEVDAYVRTAGN